MAVLAAGLGAFGQTVAQRGELLAKRRLVIDRTGENFECFDIGDAELRILFRIAHRVGDGVARAQPRESFRVGRRQDEESKLGKVGGVENLLQHPLQVRLDPLPLSTRLGDLFADLRRGHHHGAHFRVLVGSAVLARTFQRHPKAGETEVAEQALVVTKIVGEIDDLSLHRIALRLVDRLVSLGEFDQLIAARLDVVITIPIALAPSLHADGFEHRRVVGAESRQLDRQLWAEQRVHQPRRRFDFHRLATAALDLHRARAVQA